MPWIEKGQPTPFDDQPIDGLLFLDGDVLAFNYLADGTLGGKCPTIAFPSGKTCELLQDPHLGDETVVHVFGQMVLPLRIDPEAVYATVMANALLRGYQVNRAGAGGVEILGRKPEERYLAVYSEDGVLSDVVQLPARSTSEVQRISSDLFHDWQQLSDQDQLSLVFIMTQNVLHSAQGKEFAELLSLLMATLDTPANEITRSTDNGYELLDAESRERLPLPFTPEGEADDALAQVRLVQPDGRRAWYISAFDGTDLCFGMIVETDITCDYFSLAEVASIRGPGDVPVQRDVAFTATPLAALEARHLQQATALEGDGLE